MGIKAEYTFSGWALTAAQAQNTRAAYNTRVAAIANTLLVALKTRQAVTIPNIHALPYKGYIQRILT